MAITTDVPNEEPQETTFDPSIIHEHREIFVLIGLAGAGKSTVAEMIAEEHDEEVVTFEVSDFVREMFESEHDDDVNDNELGAWAAEQKAEHGNDYFVRRMAETIRDDSTPHVVISGVRSPEEARAIEEVFDLGTVTTVGIWTLPDLRFKRKYDAQPDADHEMWDTFCERNQREKWDWGAVEFFANETLHTADAIIPNHDDLDRLQMHVQNFIHGRGQYDRNPFPHDDCHRVAQYL